MYVLGLCSFFCLICDVLHPIFFCFLPYDLQGYFFSSDQQVLFQNLPKTYCFCTVSAYTLHHLKVTIYMNFFIFFLCQPLIHKHLVSLPQDYATCLEDVSIFQLGNFTCTCTIISFFPFGWFLSLHLNVVHTR